jgi:predicted acylesterase/phospholipase RssA/CRP-like cAMP-binding protein
MSSSSSRESQFSSFLQQSFGPLEEDLRGELLRQVEFLTLKAGETLCRQGDPTGAAYIVMSGRLRVAIEADGETERVINEVGRGETVGEMALLTDEPRSATVYAVRDSVLAELPRESFLGLLERYPRFWMSLTRSIVCRLRRQTSRERSGAGGLSSIALVPTDRSVPLVEFANDFVAALGSSGSVSLLGSSEVDAALGQKGISQVPAIDAAAQRLAAWIDQREASSRYLVYRADAKWSHWTERCARQADLVAFVGSGGGMPEPGDTESRLAELWRGGRAPRRILVLLHETGEPAGTARWLRVREVDEHFHIRRGVERDYARLARSVAGEALAVVLGGGGARGLAHIGVLRALEELSIPIDFIGGTSIGAVIGAMYALTREWREVQRLWKRSFRPLRDFTWPAVSLTKGSRLNRSIRNALAHYRIEDLWLPYFAVATNLTRAEQVVSRRGGLFEAVRASVSLPGIFPPCLQPTGDYHADGGLLNNVPVDIMRRIAGDGPLIAVDVSAQTELEPDPGIRTEISGWTLLASRLNPFSKRLRGPGIVSVWLRSTEVGSIAARSQMKPLADLYLETPMDDFGLMEFGALDRLATRGYELSFDRLRSWCEGRNGVAVPKRRG